MLIRYGYEMTFTCGAPTPMVCQLDRDIPFERRFLGVRQRCVRRAKRFRFSDTRRSIGQSLADGA